METTLSLPGQNGQSISGYGWVVPLGDGTVNVGIGVSSASRDVIGVNALRLLGRFAADIARRWDFDADAPLKDPTRLRLPLGGSVGPVMGPTFLVVGDAGGLANPLDGDGVDAALVSARHAVAALHRALAGGSSTALQQYATTLNDELGEFHHVARLATRLLGRPSALRLLVGAATRRPGAAGGVLRIATRALRDDAGAAERVYGTAARVARLAPERVARRNPLWPSVRQARSQRSAGQARAARQAPGEERQPEREHRQREDHGVDLEAAEQHLPHRERAAPPGRAP